MKNIQKKSGFTIVELVIVIAVIAILAAVLIPTFAGIIQKANLSSDMQAVREMNLALAADEELHGRAKSLDAAMKILADAGYDANSWVCLSTGYTVYWWSANNRLVLYNASTAEVEYPKEFNIKKLVTFDDGGEFYIYDNHHVKAVAAEIALGSSEATAVSLGDLASNTSSSSETTVTSQTSLTAISNALTSDNSVLKSALGLQSASYAYGTKELMSPTYGDNTNNAYVTMQVLAVGDDDTPELKSNGDVKENIFYISVNTAGTPSATNVTSAQKAAGDMVYNIFTQINTNQLDENVAIVLAPGTTIDVSGKEWSAVKEFEGYFGTTDAENPIVINGAELTSATGFSQTVSFNGSASKYFVTGFFGTVYGNTTIENVTFKNLKLDQPANDFEITKFQINGKPTDSRNSIGIIGGITEDATHAVANVVLRNIVVDATCDINCGADGGGLVGYIGSADPNYNLVGNVLIDNCKVSANVHNNYSYVSSGYGPVGGIVGFICRVSSDATKYGGLFSLTIKDCTFDGSVNGTTMIGAAIGDITNKCIVTFEGTNDFSGATLNSEGKALKVGSVIGTVASAAKDSLTLGGTINTAEGIEAAFYIGSTKYDLTKTKIA